MALAKSPEWDRLEQLVATGVQLSNTLADETLAYVGQEYHRFRRYAPRMLRCLKLKAASVAQPLVAVAKVIGEMRTSPSTAETFMRPNLKWHRHLRAQNQGDKRLWEVAVLFHLNEVIEIRFSPRQRILTFSFRGIVSFRSSNSRSSLGSEQGLFRQAR